MKNKFNREFDAIVVGGGNAGLTAATKLAVEGVKVLLLEQHNIPGGFATSFVRGRFEFEASLHVICQFGSKEKPGEIRKIFDELGVDLEWVSVPEAYRVILSKNNTDVIVPFGIQDLIDCISKNVPNSEDSIRKFLELGKEISEALEYLGESNGNVDKKYLIANYPNFLKTASYSVEEVFSALKAPQGMKDILYPYWTYFGIPASRISFTTFAVMIYYFMEQGAYIPKFRSTQFVHALMNRFEECGGKLECNTLVTKVLVENGKVVGVETDKGEKIGANQVLANLSPHVLFNDMIYPKSEVPEISLKRTNAQIPATAGFTMFLGLNKSAEELGLNEYSYMIMNDMNTEEQYESFKTIGYPKVQATMCLNRAIPDCSPEGTCMLNFTILYKPEAWKEVNEFNYVEIKNQIASDLIDMFEKATKIKIRDSIEEIEVASPLTYARYANSYQGIIYGYESDAWDGALTRMMMIKEDVDIEGLKIIGGYGSKTLGFSSSLSCGHLMARIALAEIKQKEDA